MSASSSGKRREKWIRRGLSVFLLFHIAVIVVMPNELFYLRHQVIGVIGPYLNTFGLHVAWKFFAPDPAPPVYIEFDVSRAAAADGKPVREKSYLPDLEDTFFFRQHYNRRVALKNILGSYPDLLRQVIVPRLVCTRYPDATNVAVSKITILAPSLSDVETGVLLNDTENRREFRFMSDEVCVEDAQ